MATQSDLVKAVVEELSLVGGGQQISAEDDALIKRRYLRVRGEEARKFTVDWNADDDIPDDALDGIAMLVADRVAPSFGLPRDPERKTMGEELLRDYRETPYAPRTQMRAQYF